MWAFQKTEALVLNTILTQDYLNALYLDWLLEKKKNKFLKILTAKSTGSVESEQGELIRNWESFSYNQNLNVDINSFPRGTFLAVLQ